MNAIIARLAASREVQSVKPWVSLRLGVLSIDIEFPSGPETAGWDEQVFRQISKLHHLSKMHLNRYGISRNHILGGGNGTRGLQLKVQSGMTLLAPVWRLTYLEFIGTSQRMDEQDVLWILNQWPRLEMLSRDFHENIDVRKTLWQLALTTYKDLQVPFGFHENYDSHDDYYDEGIEAQEDDDHLFFDDDVSVIFY